MADLRDTLCDLLLELRGSRVLDRYTFTHFVWKDTTEDPPVSEEECLMSVMRRREFDHAQNNRVVFVCWLGEDDDDPDAVPGDEEDIE
jgi:hypothetical protein